MNLFVALIPMLLISAVFLNVTVIDMKTAAPGETAAIPDEDVSLSVAILDDAWVIEGRGLDRRSVARGSEDALDELQMALAVVVAAYPLNENVTIVSQDDTRYTDIIDVMDTARAAGLPGAALLGDD
jgi:biopolymer transport protein ExbD